jgi:hypothetical protein
MTIDEALRWAHATDDELWRLVCSATESDHEKFAEMNEQAIATLATEVERLRDIAAEWQSRALAAEEMLIDQ